MQIPLTLLSEPEPIKMSSRKAAKPIREGGEKKNKSSTTPYSLTPITSSQERLGVWLGFFGMVGFSGTLPATRLAVSELDPVFVGAARSLVAGVLALLLLLFTGSFALSVRPSSRHLVRLFYASFCAFLVYPLTTSWALKSVPASHSAIVTGILPLSTAFMGAMRAGERPSTRFWICAGLGSLLVLVFAVLSGGGSLHTSDFVLLFGAIALAAGFTEGALLSRVYGGWKTICWMLITLMPCVALLLLVHGVSIPAHVSARAWGGFAYVSCISVFLAYIAWTMGLAKGGIGRVGQLQLMQPFFTLAICGVVLHEPLSPMIFLFAGGVVACIAVGRKKVLSGER